MKFNCTDNLLCNQIEDLYYIIEKLYNTYGIINELYKKNGNINNIMNNQDTLIDKLHNILKNVKKMY